MAYQVTSLGISVLALLREGPMHGYELFQTLSARHGDRMLKVRPGSLYHVVNRLAEEKLIRQTGTARTGNRPERTTYELTDAGVDTLSSRLRELRGLRDAHVSPGDRAALDYLLATTVAKLDWLTRFVDSMGAR
jgi:DNA-binding PadR family transcriptional regulator